MLDKMSLASPVRKPSTSTLKHNTDKGSGNADECDDEDGYCNISNEKKELFIHKIVERLTKRMHKQVVKQQKQSPSKTHDDEVHRLKQLLFQMIRRM